VENLLPFLADSRKSVDLWRDVAKAVGEKYGSEVTYIGVQRRFALLLQEFKKEDFQNRYKYDESMMMI
jgi:hypothetical protein